MVRILLPHNPLRFKRCVAVFMSNRISEVSIPFQKDNLTGLPLCRGRHCFYEMIYYSQQLGAGMSRTPLFVRIARPTYGTYLKRKHQIETVGLENLPADGPYLVLGNHTHLMDAFFVSTSLPVHIRWVIGAHLFKNQILKVLLQKLVGGISKQQGRSDFQTIRDISEAFKRGEVVGMFPEGTRTWDGEPLGFDETTAKLVRMFKVPVVFVLLESGYAQKPRWADKARKGRLTIRVLKPFTPEEIKQLSLQELLDHLTQQLAFSHRRWQEEHHYAYSGPAQALGLQQVLYLCPECGAGSSIVTHDDQVECAQCGFALALDAYDRFSLVRGSRSFIDVPQWHAWERGELEKFLVDAKDDTPLFPPDKGELFQLGVGNRLRLLTKRFTLSLSAQGLTLTRLDHKSSDVLGDSKVLQFPFNRIQSMIVNVKSTVELYMDDTLYRVRIHKRSSILKYIESYQTIKARATKTQAEVGT